MDYDQDFYNYNDSKPEEDPEYEDYLEAVEQAMDDPPMTTPTPQALVASVREAYDASTQGEWRGCHEGNCACGSVYAIEKDFVLARTNLNHEEGTSQNIPIEVYAANAKFIALTHNALPAILDRLATVESDLSDLRTRYALLEDFVREVASDEYNNDSVTVRYLRQEKEARALLTKLAEGKP